MIFSTGVAYGPVLYFGSARIEHNKLLRASVCLPFIDLFTSIICSMTLFSYFGHISYSKNIEMSEIVEAGPSILFVSLPSMLGMLPGGNGWSCIFYLMCILFGIATVFGYFAYYMQFIKDTECTKLAGPIQVAIITVGSFLFSLMFVTKAGYQNFLFFDKYCGTINLLFILVLQSIMIPWVYGIDKFATLIKIRTDENVNKVFIFVIKALVPIYSLAIFIIALIGEFTQEYPAEYNDGIKAAGYIIWLVPILIICICAFKPLESQESFDELVKYQYGICFDENTDRSFF